MMRLTRSELAILRMLDAAPDKALPTWKLSPGLTPNGAQTVRHRMRDRALITFCEADRRNSTITFKGMQALALAKGEQA